MQHFMSRALALISMHVQVRLGVLLTIMSCIQMVAVVMLVVVVALAVMRIVIVRVHGGDTWLVTLRVRHRATTISTSPPLSRPPLPHPPLAYGRTLVERLLHAPSSLLLLLPRSHRHPFPTTSLRL